MHPSSPSYLKTTVLAASSGALVIGLTLVAARDLTGLSRALVEGAGWLVGLASGCVALAGAVTLVRSKRRAEGRRDLFLDLNASRDPEAVSRGEFGWGLRVRRLFRRASGTSHPLVGDLVEIRPLEEIESTLDESGCLDGLPFMPEMGGFCGRRIRVFRCVDKILDFGRSWRLRRLEDTVLLAGLRCDGGAHGGCQASGYLLWKRGGRGLPAPGARQAQEDAAGDARVRTRRHGAGARRRRDRSDARREEPEPRVVFRRRDGEALRPAVPGRDADRTDPGEERPDPGDEDALHRPGRGRCVR